MSEGPISAEQVRECARFHKIEPFNTDTVLNEEATACELNALIRLLLESAVASAQAEMRERCEKLVDDLRDTAATLGAQDHPLTEGLKAAYLISAYKLESMLFATPEPAASAPIEMYLCEIPHLILHANQTYRFIAHPDCEGCKLYSNPPATSYCEATGQNQVSANVTLPAAASETDLERAKRLIRYVNRHRDCAPTCPACEDAVQRTLEEFAKLRAETSRDAFDQFWDIAAADYGVSAGQYTPATLIQAIAEAVRAEKDREADELIEIAFRQMREYLMGNSKGERPPIGEPTVASVRAIAKNK